jgi:hypothetical protein
MNNHGWTVCAALGLILSGGAVQAGWNHVGSYSHAPRWSLFSRHDKAATAEKDPRGNSWHDQFAAPTGPYVSPYAFPSPYIPSPVNPFMQFAVPHDEVSGSRILLVDGPGGY